MLPCKSHVGHFENVQVWKRMTLIQVLSKKNYFRDIAPPNPKFFYNDFYVKFHVKKKLIKFRFDFSFIFIVGSVHEYYTLFLQGRVSICISHGTPDF